MLKFAVPVIRVLSLQGVSRYHHHWRPNTGFYFPSKLNLFLIFTILVARGLICCDQFIHLLGQRAKPTLEVSTILDSAGSDIIPASDISFLVEAVNRLLLSLGHILLFRRGYINLFRSREIFVLDSTHGSLNIRLIRNAVSTVPSDPKSPSTSASGHRR